MIRHHIHGRFTPEEMREAEIAFDDWVREHPDDPEPTDEEVEAAGDAYLSWLEDFSRGK
jgi:hypothetical protein